MLMMRIIGSPAPRAQCQQHVSSAPVMMGVPVDRGGVAGGGGCHHQCMI
eukprot:SAG31_NODE_7874_length_1576_cov_1.626947_3_plen_48_part_01